MRLKTLLFAAFLPVLFLPVSGGDSWKAGIAKEIITPPELGWMAGYAARKGPAESVSQDLFTKAAVIEDGEGARIVVVTLDLIGVPRPLRDDIESHVSKKHGIPPGHLLINASHTHSGPAIRLYRPDGGKGAPRVGYDRVPEEEQPLRVAQIERYNEFLRKKTAACIDRAVGLLAPAEISWSRARCGFAMNRRTPVGAGNAVSYKNSPNPDGPVDHEVPVLQLRNAEGALQGVLFGYACHATTMGTMEIHGDWPGFAQQYFEEDHPGVVAMFVNGCSGDQNPYPRRMLPFLHRHGRSMAMAVEAALLTPRVPLEGPLRAAIAWPEIPYSELPGKAELEERISRTSGYEKRYAEFLLAELQSRGALPESYPVPVQVIRFGDSLTLVAIGGETVVDYSLRLKKELAGVHDGPVWVAGYSNDVMTYLPSARVLREGGYEGRTSMYFIRSSIHPAPWSPDIEEAIIGTAHRLFRENDPDSER